MASRKQKHALMLEKRAAREAAVAEVGRKALEVEHAKRKAEEARMWEDAHKVHLKRNRFHDQCEHCAKIKAKQALERIARAAKLTKAGVSDADNPHLEEVKAVHDDQLNEEQISA